jgi:hypothetical protein
MQLVHILHLFHDKQFILQSPRRKNTGDLNPQKEETKECVLFFLSNNQEIPVQKGMNMKGEMRCTPSDWETFPTGI